MDCSLHHGNFGAGCPHCMRPLSPCCRKPLEGGPVIYVCTGCGHDVHGSVIDREYQPTTSPVAGRCRAQVPVSRHGQTLSAVGGQP